ncbi:MAG: patatin-like phospholipase family protein [Deltaproteobacteria bacterium]|nr:patatin-like phospholipase family protein [Deltaproteobacteria bacterium]
MARIGVVFSSGFFGFFAHAGFLRALRELGIEVSGYAGASSGAIVAAMAASGMGDEAIRGVLFRLKKSDFWDPDPPRVLIREVLRCFRGYSGYLKGVGFARLLDRIPLRRIEDSPVPLVVAATNLTRRRQELFTKGDLGRALQASGAVPMLFKPVEIGGSLYVDGGVVNKAPLVGLADLLKPEKIIVHLIPSADMAGEGRGFLNRPLTPWHIQHLTFSICRYEAYKREQILLRERGVQLLEVVADPPPVGPGSLTKGPLAYDKVYQRTLEILRRS